MVKLATSICKAQVNQVVIRINEVVGLIMMFSALTASFLIGYFRKKK
jgi:hypothetical protein